MYMKQYKTPTVVSSIVVVDALTCCVLLCCVCDLKDAEMNVQYILIWELRLYEFKFGHHTIEATKKHLLCEG